MIGLVYGLRQRFRYRYRDITLRGRVHGAVPVRSAAYRLNDGRPVAFYVEALAAPAQLDWRFAYKQSPARLRLPHAGEFTIEIAVGSIALQPGPNRLVIEVEDARGVREAAEVELLWDPRPVRLPLDLSDLSHVSSIQDVGQVVDGAFDLDRDANAIRARSPVAPDALLVVSAPHGSQEATYALVFDAPERGKGITQPVQPVDDPKPH